MTQRVEVPGVGVVEFPEGMSDSDITKAITTNILPNYGKSTSRAGEFGRSAASGADTVLNILSGGLDALARLPARAYYQGVKGMTGPELEAKLQQETTSPKDVIGRAFGVSDTPEYQGQLARRGVEAVGEAVRSNVTEPVAKAFGVSPEYVEDIFTAVAPIIPGPSIRAAKATARGAQAAGGAVARAPGQMVQGALNVARSPDAPVASRVVPEEVIQQATTGVPGVPGSNIPEIRRGQPAEMTNLGELVTRMGRGDVPIKGRLVESTTENVVRGYQDALRGNYLGRGGLQTAADIAGLLGVGVPFQGSLIRGSVPVAKAFSPIKAVDVPTPGGTVPGFTSRSGVPYMTMEDLQAARERMRPDSAPGPSPVAPEATGPIVQSMQDRLAKMRQQMMGTKIPEAESPGVRKQAAEVKDARNQTLDQVISDIASGSSDWATKYGVPTGAIDVADMAPNIRGFYKQIKEKVGGALDELPDTAWLKEHGLTDQAFILRVYKNILGNRGKSFGGPAPVAPTPTARAEVSPGDAPLAPSPPGISRMLTADDLPSSGSGMIKAGSQESPLSYEQYEKSRFMADLSGEPFDLTFKHPDGRILTEVSYVKDGVRIRTEMWEGDDKQIGSQDFDRVGNVALSKGYYGADQRGPLSSGSPLGIEVSPSTTPRPVAPSAPSAPAPGPAQSSVSRKMVADDADGSYEKPFRSYDEFEGQVLLDLLADKNINYMYLDDNKVKHYKRDNDGKYVEQNIRDELGRNWENFIYKMNDNGVKEITYTHIIREPDYSKVYAHQRITQKIYPPGVVNRSKTKGQVRVTLLDRFPSNVDTGGLPGAFEKRWVDGKPQPPQKNAYTPDQLQYFETVPNPLEKLGDQPFWTDPIVKR